ncbi:hypothetical protein L9F63_010765, partial [Diploptera punctata]
YHLTRSINSVDFLRYRLEHKLKAIPFNEHILYLGTKFIKTSILSKFSIKRKSEKMGSMQNYCAHDTKIKGRKTCRRFPKTIKFTELQEKMGLMKK